MAIRTWRCIHVRYFEVVDHPTFVPAAFVVDDKHRIDVGKDVDKSAWVVRIGGKPRFGFQHNTDGADRGQSAIRSRDRQLHMVIDTWKDCREYVRLKTRSIQKIVLEEL